MTPPKDNNDASAPLLEHPVATASVCRLTPPRIRYLNLLHTILRVHGPSEAAAILEWGTGHSTCYLLELARKAGAARLVTIDHHRHYQERVVQAIGPDSLLAAHCLPLIGAQLQRGRDDSHNYATFPLSLGLRFSLIYVDGRRRNECMLAAREVLTPHGVIICHDATRQRYQLGFRLFETISVYQRAGGFQVMRLPAPPPPRDDGSGEKDQAR